MSGDSITANIARVLRLAHKVDAFEAGEGRLDGVADLLRKLAAALRRDVDAELARLRAAVERLTERLADAENAAEYNRLEVEGLKEQRRDWTETRKRLTRERDAEAACVDRTRAELPRDADGEPPWGELPGLVKMLRERAETAERERDDVRREVCEVTELGRHDEPSAEQVAAEHGWGYLYPESSPTTGATKDDASWCDECEDVGAWACSKHAEDDAATTGGDQP